MWSAASEVNKRQVWVLNDKKNVKKKRVKIGIKDNRNVVDRRRFIGGRLSSFRMVIDGLPEGAKVGVVGPQPPVADEKSPPRHEGQKGARA
ncbi:hypothetical protein SE11_22670 [Salmonella enterica subsp. enterica serovar Braenderup]|nr:hypothetical protein SE11_22670 [Salmonella enterica subsp. enterica serovar Braenderup]